MNEAELTEDERKVARGLKGVRRLLCLAEFATEDGDWREGLRLLEELGTKVNSVREKVAEIYRGGD